MFKIRTDWISILMCEYFWEIELMTKDVHTQSSDLFSVSALELSFSKARKKILVQSSA